MSLSIPNNTDTDALVSTCAPHRDSGVLRLLFCSPDTHWSFSPNPQHPHSCPRIHAWRHRGRPEGQRALRWQSRGWLGIWPPSNADCCPWTKPLLPEACFPLGDFLLHCQLSLSVNVPQWCPHKLSTCFSPREELEPAATKAAAASKLHLHSQLCSYSFMIA